MVASHTPDQALDQGRGRVHTRLTERIRAGVIGEGAVFDGPYGPRRTTYADYVATGRSLDFIEDYIRDQVLPGYANTHSAGSRTAAGIDRLREEAREIIHRAVGGTEDHLVIFTGSGTTAAVNKLVGILELRAGGELPALQRPVVFVGPYEHHSNELPWRETVADVVEIGLDADGRLDLYDLSEQLSRYRRRPLRIGSFSAASNVTGVLTEVDAVSAMLHANGAFAFWDYAAAAPYVDIRVAESAPGRGDSKDAVFLSPHKFMGGPQTPGILVVRRDLVRNAVPTAPGGGTVAYVDQNEHHYLSDPVKREEGGTPAIVESIRAGLVFALKQQVGPAVIRRNEEELWRHVGLRWRRNPDIDLLGNVDDRRLAVASFRIRYGSQFLHHNFVATLLNDVFGIQARGGCSCAGPYGHRLLGIDGAQSQSLRDLILAGWEGIKPGWARLSFNYFISDLVADYLIEAVELIAQYGYRLLPDYRFDPRTGVWRHHSEPEPAGPRLAAVSFLDPGLPERAPASERSLVDHLQQGRELFARRPMRLTETPPPLPEEFEQRRWFPLPAVCVPTPGRG
jgi:selenocysteine lyase/cysteine desulfurase